MTSSREPDDDDTREHQATPRYPDAPPPADAGRGQATDERAGELSSAGEQAGPDSQPTAQWPQAGQQWQQPGETWPQAPASPSAPPAQQPPAQPWQQPPQQWQQPPQWQQPQGAAAGWGPPPEYRGSDYPTSPLVVIAGIILILFGLLTTLIGGLGVALGGFLEDAIREASSQGVTGLEGVDLSAISGVFVVIFAFVLIIGILHLLSGIGVFLHKQWARIVGIVLAVLGTLFGVLGIVGAASVRGSADGSEWAFPIAMTLAYGFTLFALIAGSNHFRRRWSR